MKIPKARLVDALEEIKELEELASAEDLPFRWCYSCEKESRCQFHSQCQRMSCECSCPEFIYDPSDEPDYVEPDAEKEQA